MKNYIRLKVVSLFFFGAIPAFGAGVTAAKGKTLNVFASGGGGSGDCATCVHKTGDTMTGTLLMSNAAITLTGVNGNIVSQASVTANQFFGDGANVTGITQANVTGLVSALAGKVAKAGDTMTGELVMSGTSFLVTGAQTAPPVKAYARDSQGLVLDIAAPSGGSLSSGSFAMIRSTSGTSGLFIGRAPSSTLDTSILAGVIYALDQNKIFLRGPGVSGGVSAFANKVQLDPIFSSGSGLLDVDVDSATISGSLGVHVTTGIHLSGSDAIVSGANKGVIFYNSALGGLYGSDNGGTPYPLDFGGSVTDSTFTYLTANYVGSGAYFGGSLGAGSTVQFTTNGGRVGFRVNGGGFNSDAAENQCTICMETSPGSGVSTCTVSPYSLASPMLYYNTAGTDILPMTIDTCSRDSFAAGAYKFYLTCRTSGTDGPNCALSPCYFEISNCTP